MVRGGNFWRDFRRKLLSYLSEDELREIVPTGMHERESVSVGTCTYLHVCMSTYNQVEERQANDNTQRYTYKEREREACM